MAGVLIISEDPKFCCALLSRWRAERNVPELTVLNGVVWNGSGPGPYDLAIVGPFVASPSGSGADVAPEGTQEIRTVAALEAGPVIFAHPNPAVLQAVKHAEPRAILLRMQEEWTESLLVFAGEVLRRVEATARARHAEQVASQVLRQATLGRYMLEMRHGVNNALTSVLGNAELLLLEPGTLSPDVREQIATIQNMALRMHDVMQRFSAIESEMIYCDKQSQGETRR